MTNYKIFKIVGKKPNTSNFVSFYLDGQVEYKYENKKTIDFVKNYPFNDY